MKPTGIKYCIGSLVCSLLVAASSFLGCKPETEAELSYPRSTSEAKAEVTYPKSILEIETEADDQQSIFQQIRNEERLKRRKEIFWETPIEYVDFYNIDFNAFPEEKIDLPEAFYDRINSDINLPRIEDKEKLENIVRTETEKRGYDWNTISELDANESINLCIDIVCGKIDYYDVDLDKDFINKYGSFLPIENYLEIGLGDCDKYAYAFIATFNIMKEKNVNLSNIYVSTSRFGGNFLFHEWNSIFGFDKENTKIMTHIDLTFYDNGGKLEAKRGYHITENTLELNASLFGSLGAFERSYTLYEDLYEKADDLEEKARFLDEMGILSMQLRDSSMMETVRERFKSLYDKEELLYESEHYDNILYYSYYIESDLGNNEYAAKYASELIEKYPDSFWINYID